MAAALLCGAAPPLIVDDGLEPKGAFERETAAAWRDLDVLFEKATGATAPGPREPIRLRRAEELTAGQSGVSRPGLALVRQNQPWTLDEKVVLALRHEIAHQYLWAACAQASADRLFHEAFAVATSGEAALWADGPYLSTPQARSALEKSASLDTREARRAIARLLSEGQPSVDALAPPLARRLRACAGGVRWVAAMTPAELGAGAPAAQEDAFVALSRHSGEVLVGEGAFKTAMPFGSTLKPFVVAGAKEPGPALKPDARRAEWACGDDLPAQMEAAEALLRSCNGYFLDWAARSPQIASLGPWAAVLKAAGLERAPTDAPEAIGVQPSLTISALGLAQAYRLLAEARPELMRLLEQNVQRGTLSKLEGTAGLAGWATKTGTLRDSESRPKLGWIVAVNKDVVAVMVRSGKQPRSFASELSEALARVASPADAAAEVQVFGLLPQASIEVACSTGFVADPQGPRPVGHQTSLLALVLQGPIVCLGGPFAVRFPGVAPREYAGIFSYSPAPQYVPPPGASVTERQRKARRGSDFVLRTRLARYVAGVLASEESGISGEPRAALARVIAHNVGVQERHPGRPVCDTTHCQAFQGTAAPRPRDLAALARPAGYPGWLHFYAGGDEPWVERRSAREVEAALGAAPRELRIDGLRVTWTRAANDGEQVFEERVAKPCEVLRGPLKLPSCPILAREEGGWFLFEGRGAGHGVGLNISAARRSGADQDAVLREAFGGPAAP